MLLSDIGLGTSALYCLTNKTTCCSATAGGRHGDWRLPNGTSVTESFAAPLFLYRGISSLVIERRNNALSQIGIYTCLIPDAENRDRTLYLGVYGSTSEGNCIALLYMRIKSVYRSVLRFSHCITVL